MAGSLVQLANARGWRILQAAIMTNHVHVVVMACPDDGPTVRRVLKGVTQAALSKFNGQPRRWWTEDGSDRYKNDHPAIDAAIGYVAKQEGRMAGVVDMRAFVVESGEPRFLD